MSDSHTPGPWFHVGGADKRMAPYIRVIGDEPGIAAVAQVCGRGGSSQNEANARLIAAAPDLLAALRSLVAAAEASGQPLNEWAAAPFAIARAAIAKAEGRS